MYTIIIVDDETIERKVLKKLIYSLHLDIQVIGEAANGEEAVRQCIEKQPDIVIMDIRMPIIDGIKASMIIREKCKKTHVIISSAYSDYEYMVGAIDLGVDRYLLKPYDNETLRSALTHSLIQINAEQQKKKDKQALSAKLSFALPLVENQFVNSAINGTLSKSDYSEYFSLLNVDLSNGVVLAFRLKTNEDTYQEEQKRVNVKFKNIFHQIYREMHKHFSCALAIADSNCIVAIASIKEIRDDYSVRTFIFKVANSICADIEQLFSNKIQVGISEVYKSISGLIAAYEQVYHSLNVSDNSGFITECKNKIQDVCMVDRYPVQKEKNMLFAIKSGDKKLYQQCINELFEWFKSVNPLLDFPIIGKVYMSALISNIQKLIVNKLDLTQEYDILHIDVFDKMESIEDILKLKDMIDNTVYRMMEALGSDDLDRTNRLIMDAEKYISNFYFEEITLDDLAGSALLSPQYFSKLFKEKTGETFIKYLKKTRMEKTNELLENSELPAVDICHLVGYHDPDYFFKVYKNYYSMTPSEFRKKVKNI